MSGGRVATVGTSHELDAVRMISRPNVVRSVGSGTPAPRGLGQSRWWRLLVMMVAVAATLGGCSPGSDEPPAAKAPSLETSVSGQGVVSSIPDIVSRVQPSVVAILAGQAQGSGVVWNADGVVVTNNHVVAGSRQLEVAFADGQRASAQVIATDPQTDLAVLRAARTSLPAAVFADALPRVGELAIAMGNPLGFQNTVTAGIISGLGRAIPGSARQSPALIDLVQTDAAISPGNSGGALVGPDGRVVGINVAYIPPEAGAESLGFAIPASTVRDVVTQLLESGRVQHAFFGILPGPLTPEIAQRFNLRQSRGVLVLEVTAGSPAASAGIRPGDVLTRAGNRPLETVEDFLGVVRARNPGDSLPVTLVRSGNEQTVTVRLGQRSG